MTPLEALLMIMAAAIVTVICIGVYLGHPGPAPYPPPPDMRENFEAFLEWQANNPNLTPAIRLAAATTLQKLADRRHLEQTIRIAVSHAVRDAVRGIERC